eukprot:13449384-Heterocapsa_arctica.AAC.1
MFGPAPEAKAAGKKRGAEEDTITLKFSQAAEYRGSAMDQTSGGVEAVPGPMTQPEGQEPAPMEQDARGELTPEEQEAWNRSQMARAAEIGEDLAKKITAEKEEAAAKEAPRAKGSAGKGRSPDPERILRRSLRSPSKGKDKKAGDTGIAPSLESVLEEGEDKKVPSDEEAEESQEDGEEEKVEEKSEAPPEDEI